MSAWQVAIGSIEDVDDGDGRHQRGTFSGFAGERYTRVMRPQPFGFSSVPPPGSRGLLAFGGANREIAFALGFEHQDHRPTGQVSGATAIYGAHGEIVSLVGSTIRIKAATIILDGDVKLGGEGASRPLALEGSVDSNGDEIEANLATKVWGM